MKRLLIANRGEIARRILRSAKVRGLETVLACSEADEDSVAAREADSFVVIGPAQAQKSYLNIEAILESARDSEADAVHPGYGFLSENPDFAQAVIDAGLTWVGPLPETIRLMGDKAAARRAAEEAGVPILPGSDGLVDDKSQAHDVAEQVGFPLMIKAAAGGGGRGIRVVREASDFDGALDQVRTEAQASFGDSRFYIERFVERARHVEVQILGDGNTAIHLGDRDCSMQRRSQKVLEEAPAPKLPDDIREQMRSSSVALAESCGYTGAGTVEFLYDPQRREAAFIEMNTRLQVEHPVTEVITGIDLVAEQLRIADGEALELDQGDVEFRGHAFECRLNAEDPTQNFFPSPGRITGLTWPDRPSVRVDSAVESGSDVAPYYDSMIAKLIVHGSDRADALDELRQALDETTVDGVATTLDLHRSLAARPELVEVTHHTHFIEETPDVLPKPEQS
ncbi:acetyl-CoA carboxylase biotin carboxylase subunit [Nesterenkonia marinintestina]|uniref:acetyl-CoA carboxylase biotin carboxylase subunit n=1 Tax=Nesterenkonia marinintestina TaxID=2979865 RepID=UPI0021BE58B7|nr:acetyl-CoA carboxylase biotin carboxylase subunit [Nesterenkonia sp. GX14115]